MPLAIASSVALLLPPMREEYFLGQDGACHWYVVPVAHRADWDEWCNLSEDDERAWDPVLREYSFGQRRGPSSPFVVPGQVPSVATYMLCNRFTDPMLTAQSNAVGWSGARAVGRQLGMVNAPTGISSSCALSLARVAAQYFGASSR